MIAEITTALQGTKIISDLIEKYRKSKTPRDESVNLDEISTALYEQKIKLTAAMDVAIATKEKQVALVQEVADLKEENKKLKDWSAEKERYALTMLIPGVPVRRVKPGLENGEAPHYLCANCFDRGEKSYLRFHSRSGTYVCHPCKDEIRVPSVHPKPEEPAMEDWKNG